MTQQIQDVTVQRISLLTSDNKPAVPKAETRFALFKSVPRWLEKLKKHFRLDAEDRYDDEYDFASGTPRVWRTNKIYKAIEKLEENQLKLSK